MPCLGWILGLGLDIQSHQPFLACSFHLELGLSGKAVFKKKTSTNEVGDYLGISTMVDSLKKDNLDLNV